MSDPIRRRSSSRQLLQDLIQVTAQRSLEDAEEMERERRRRSRERQREEGSSCSLASQQNKMPFTGRSRKEVGPGCCLFQEEDEGFSDWSQKLENRSDAEHYNVKAEEPSILLRKAGRNDENKHDDEEQKQCQPQGRSNRSPSIKGVTQLSCSKVVRSHDAKQQKVTEAPTDTLLHLSSGNMSDGVCMAKEEGVQQIVYTSSKRPTHGNDQEEEDVNLTHEEMEIDDFQKSEKEGYRTGESTNRQPNLSCNSDEDETLKCYGAMSPTFKKLLIQFYPDELKSRAPTEGKCVITERTESLRKSSNVKKTMNHPLSVSKIDKKLQQYTHALEVSKEGKSVSPGLVDVRSPITSKKNLFEEGVASNQSTLTNTQLKEIKLGGVLNKKNAWEKLSDIGSSGKESKPREQHP
ncbi:uncharacterized protein LOC144070665 [Stigmatopora argus]